MGRYVLDIETNGLLADLSRVHCLGLLNIDTGERLGFADAPGYNPISDGLDLILGADLLIMHNGVAFDRPAIEKVYEYTIPLGRVFDTLVASRLLYPEERDHRLGAWGKRLGLSKGNYAGGWETFNDDMFQYMLRDLDVTLKLYRKLVSKEPAEQALKIEHAFAEIIASQERRGFAFDRRGAEELYQRLLTRRIEIEAELQRVFPPWIVPGPMKLAKRNMTLTLMDPDGVVAKRKIAAGDSYRQHEVVQFNPSSRQHIAARLTKLHGWKPAAFTEGGQPVVDEGVLGGLPYPEAKLLNEYLIVRKRIGQLAEGSQAWLKCERNGRIYGRVNTNGALTGRCSHSNPNVAQVPTEKEYRKLWRPSPGYVLVGVDASGLELRCLAHYVAAFDGGEYAKVVTSGDPHTFMQNMAGLPDRPTAKVFTYAYLYGAGDLKLGSIIMPTASEAKRKVRGKEARAAAESNFAALGRLKTTIAATLKDRKHLRGLDGRRLEPRSAHAALNTLLQSAGAVVMKQALVLLEERLRSQLIRGTDYAYVANIHDEIQAEVLPRAVDLYKACALEAIAEAAPALKFRCPLAGEAKAGANWSETH